MRKDDDMEEILKRKTMILNTQDDDIERITNKRRIPRKS